MKHKFGVAAIMTILAAFFASSRPDGLDKTAETLGFAAKSRANWSPLPDYNIPGLSGPVSTVLAALAGLAIFYGLYRLTAKLAKEKPNTETR